MAEESFLAAIAAEVALVPSDSATAIIEVDQQFDLATAIKKAEEHSPAWVIQIPRLGAILESLAKCEDVTVFAVPDLTDELFATNQEVIGKDVRVLVEKGLIGRVVSKKSSDEPAERTITKIFKTEEERFVLGVVLAPETADSQGDIYSHAEVRKAAHEYMVHARDLGKQHREIVTGKLCILENYVAPVDFEIGEEKVVNGTWIMGIRVVDDELWDGIKKGDFTGFSIGGAAYRKPIDP